MKKWIFNVLIYISLLFLFVYLYKLDYFSFREVSFNLPFLFLSTLLLWCGYVLSSISWWKILQVHSIQIQKRHAIVSHGLSIFAKYIPGKIWVILGRAGYISNLNFSLKTTSFLSLKEQLIYVWEGLLISGVPMLLIYGLNRFSIIVLGLIVFFTFFLFSRVFHNWFISIFKKITKRELDIPLIKFTEHLQVIAYVLVYWIVWLFAFYFFVGSLYTETHIRFAFAFPLSVTIGLLAIIFPGGIGVREGIMSSYLVMSGIPLEIATVVAVYARLWFISGEVFIFLLASILRLFGKKN